jgi:SAM-dependent methyltransferase
LNDPADFYTGLVAELYAPLRGDTPDPALYERFVRRHGEPALELACGDGDPLLDLRALGLDVHGLDASQDMLDRCRARAAARGLEVTLFHQRIEAMSLPSRYRSIFLAGASFNLLPDDAAAAEGLRAIARHLEPGGTALIPLFVPRPGKPGIFRTERLEDGTEIRCGVVDVRHDTRTRTQRTLLRYERLKPGQAAEALERDWLIHWHERDGFAALCEAAGLEIVRTYEGGEERGGWSVLVRRRAPM